MKYVRHLACMAALIIALLPATASALVILQYHHISESTPAATSTSPARFVRHLELIEAAGFAVVSLPQVLAALESEQPLPDKTVLITFDDAYESIYSVAHPLLKTRGWPYVVFVSTDAVDSRARHMMTWDQLQQMSREGAAMANHSRTHGHLVRRTGALTDDQWATQVMADIEQAEARIKAQTGHGYRAFAYPYGESNQALQTLLDQAGYVAFGQQSGPATRRDKLALARFPMGGDYGDDADFTLKLRTLPLPYEGFRLQTGTGADLPDGVLARADRPVLSYQLPASIAGQVRCYVSGQGLAQAHQADAGWVAFQAGRPLAPGRSRYNCTAPAGKGRFYWHSTAFLRPKDDGNWPFEP
ncbi:polysaccharide deacetylase family protein [Simiduia agarivorans]|nr:polysaccharide deacetylase family protein [Simiduia agarivorans]